jgi:multiple sugar transport system permease protein
MIARFNAQYAINTHVPRMMAGSVILLVPVLIIYGIFQKWIIESVMVSAVKE